MTNAASAPATRPPILPRSNMSPIASCDDHPPKTACAANAKSQPKMTTSSSASSRNDQLTRFPWGGFGEDRVLDAADHQALRHRARLRGHPPQLGGRADLRRTWKIAPNGKGLGKNQRQRRSLPSHCPHPARHAHARKFMKSLAWFGSRLHDWVRGKLVHRRWSPAQIACKFRVRPVVRHWFENHWRGHPDDPRRLIGPETIHAARFAPNDACRSTTADHSSPMIPIPDIAPATPMPRHRSRKSTLGNYHRAPFSPSGIRTRC